MEPARDRPDYQEPKLTVLLGERMAELFEVKAAGLE
jgi:hypothetical protein